MGKTQAREKILYKQKKEKKKKRGQNKKRTGRRIS